MLPPPVDALALRAQRRTERSGPIRLLIHQAEFQPTLPVRGFDAGLRLARGEPSKATHRERRTA
jgi:hypothetical protein